MSDIFIRKAGPTDLEALLPLVAAYHAFEAVETKEDVRRRVVGHLLDDPTLGTIWCAALDSVAVGYLALCYGYSIEFGGRDAFVDEFFVLEGQRGAGIGGRLLEHARDSAAAAGIVALHLEVDRENTGARRSYERQGFAARGRFHLMSATL